MEEVVNNTTFEGFCSRYKISCLATFSRSLLGHIVANMVLSAVLAVATVLANGLVFAAYYYSESLRRPAHVLLLSLAAADLLTGAIAQPLFIMRNALLITGCSKAICTVQRIEWSALVCLMGATMFNLSLITLDRYIAVCHAFRYLEIVAPVRVKRVACLLWFIWAATVVAWMVNSGRQSILFAIVVPFNVVFIASLYMRIYRDVRRVATNPQTAGNAGAVNEQMAQQRKSQRTLGLIFGLLFICFVPALIYIILRHSNVMVLYEYNEPAMLFSTNVVFSNSFLNVLVYYWRNEEMREGMRKVLRKVRQKFQNQVNP